MHPQFPELYQRYHVRIYQVVLHYMQHPGDAEEVTQDVFVELHDHLGQFRGEAQLGTWLYRIAVNKSLDALRYRGRQKRSGLLVSLFGREEDDRPLEIPDFVHPGVLAERQEDSRLLYAAINRLPEAQQTAFLLAYVEELPQREVAEIMNLSLKAVESLLQRAKARLRTLLENHFDHQRKPQ